MQVSLPMLAPLLLGTGMLFRSIKSNASFLFPRIGLVVVLMWVLWFANSVVQSTVNYLQRQGALDHRVSAAVITGSELFTMLGAGVIVLSALGVNVSGLLLPAGVCLAIAAKDLAHNFLAGEYMPCVTCPQPAAFVRAVVCHSRHRSWACLLSACMKHVILCCQESKVSCGQEGTAVCSPYKAPSEGVQLINRPCCKRSEKAMCMQNTLVHCCAVQGSFCLLFSPSDWVTALL